MHSYAVLFTCGAVLLCGVLAASGYQDQSRADKGAYLSSKIEAGSGSGPWPSTFGLAKIFFESMAPSFDHVADEFPKGRNKLIHSVGPIAKAAFVAAKGSPYSGLFEGADTGFARVSFAKQSSDTNIAPGCSLKFMRDGMASGNIMALFDLSGQDNDMNFFSNNFTNHPELTAPDTATKLLKKKFSSASKFPRYLGLSEFSSHRQDGSKADANTFPFEVVFEANNQIRAQTAKSGTDADLLAATAKIAPGTILFNTHCRAAPGAELLLCGFVKTTGPFAASKYGDTDLFFQHTRMEDDFALHPEWPQVPQ